MEISENSRRFVDR